MRTLPKRCTKLVSLLLVFLFLNILLGFSSFVLANEPMHMIISHCPVVISEFCFWVSIFPLIYMWVL